MSNNDWMPYERKKAYRYCESHGIDTDKPTEQKCISAFVCGYNYERKQLEKENAELKAFLLETGHCEITYTEHDIGTCGECIYCLLKKEGAEA